MRETPFTLHDDPEEVSKHELMIDPEGKGSFSLEQWLKLMEHKTNYVEEDLIKSFKVFDLDELNTVNKDELKVVMMNLIGKDLASED